MANKWEKINEYGFDEWKMKTKNSEYGCFMALGKVWAFYDTYNMELYASTLEKAQKACEERDKKYERFDMVRVRLPFCIISTCKCKARFYRALRYI